MKIKLKNQLLLFIFIALISAFIGGFTWAFFKVFSLGTSFFWEWLPAQIPFTGYTIVICLIGGVLLGFFHKKYGNWPQEPEAVVETIQKEKHYPYNHIFMICVASLLPLLFGGSVGPVGGFVGVTAGLFYWAGDNFKYAVKHVHNITKAGETATFKSIFHAPLFGILLPIDEKPDENNVEKLPKPVKIPLYIIAALCGCGVFLLLTKTVGLGLGIPKLTVGKVSYADWVWIPVFLLVGIICQIISDQSERIIKKIYKPFSSGNQIFLATISGGLILGIIGTYSPLVLSSGLKQMDVLTKEYLSYTPLMLIAIGIVKLILTNISIQSGWRGGHFFPVIFAAVSIGYGVSLLTGTEPVYSITMITASMFGFSMKKPIVVVLLLISFFPIKYITGIILVSFVGALIGKLNIFTHKKEITGSTAEAL